MTVDRNDFGWPTTTDDVLEGVDVTGPTALVTGGSSDIGIETARAVAAHGDDLIRRSIATTYSRTTLPEASRNR